MKTLTIELPEEETRLFKQLLKKLNGRIISQSTTPNKDTSEAIKELKDSKGVKFDSVSALFKSI